MKKLLKLFTVWSVFLYVIFFYSLPRVAELSEKMRISTEDVLYTKIASEINGRSLQEHAGRFNNAFMPNKAYYGCLYYPQNLNDTKSPLVIGGFRFFLNAYISQPEKFEEEVLALYQKKYPHALFMVEPRLTFITRSPGGEILGWEERRGGFSIWYAPGDALDFLCFPEGIVFA